MTERYRRRAEELGVEPPFPMEEIARMTFAMADGIALQKLLDPESVPDDVLVLPPRLPPGMVCVLGTRPNDALKPLELLDPHYEYRLPSLSRADFRAILAKPRCLHSRMTADRFLLGDGCERALSRPRRKGIVRDGIRLSRM